MARGARLLLVIALLAALLAVALQLYRLRKPRLWTVEELSVYNGTDEELPILLGILGSVFDVTKGRSHYGPGGGYHHFAGRLQSYMSNNALFNSIVMNYIFAALVNWFYKLTYPFPLVASHADI